MRAVGAEAAFAAALLDPSLPDPSLPDPSLPGPSSPGPDMRGGGRFSVYRNNVVVGLVDALAATYPAVRALVGEEFFRAAAREFVRAHPPCSPVLIDYGGAFPGWIAHFPPAAGVPYLDDVARLEWAWSRAYNAADVTPLVVDALVNVPPEQLAEARVILHPSATVVISRNPVVSLWAEATGREARSRLDLRSAETALVARPWDRVEVRRIDAATSVFLTGLGCRMAFGASVERASACESFDLATQISGLFANGLVAAVEHPGKCCGRPGGKE